MGHGEGRGYQHIGHQEYMGQEVHIRSSWSTCKTGVIGGQGLGEPQGMGDIGRTWTTWEKRVSRSLGVNVALDGEESNWERGQVAGWLPFWSPQSRAHSYD